MTIKCDEKYSENRNLLKNIVGTKNEIWDIIGIKNLLNPYTNITINFSCKRKYSLKKLFKLILSFRKK
jgi:hypothetical protein